ncbi:uncharacterized protein LOC129600299 [Paramacrobiotus metropolitanus]|uniref:uncharacterized protein LOC129600299 n=1 Tax=Paramacrobiotus metropolitanus TaxID=2943436 RepID=UPI002445D50A|nr:uncharacterized protein LOC129600299 [Paramacrobiotus metropolitanus]XP_055354760.1 uncharacterized protein LOC129600299 [Paramacrobiotus metropolitanus]XP_055354761.1 uncharacterized protein LOC129600299 [Paramacrobiotus metropolitanus]
MKKQHFAGMRQVRMIRLYACTIASLEAYTFTDLPSLDSLALENGLGFDLQRLQKDYQAQDMLPVFLNQADFVIVRRLHCDCSLAWLRNFLKRKPHLTASKKQGQVAVIGIYITPSVGHYWDEWPHIFSVDCSRDLAYDNIRAGTQFSYNTSCHTAAQC